MDFRALIRDIPDFPVPGILFRDITPLLADPRALAELTEMLAERYADQKIDRVVGIESRGFIFGTPLACRLGVGFVPIRKQGKLPHKTIEASYDLEYGQATIAMHEDALEPGQRVLLVDDLIATGGTLAASCELIERAGAEVAEIVSIIELTGLDGRVRLGNRPVFSLIQY